MIYKIYAKVDKKNVVTQFVSEKYKIDNDGLILVNSTNTNPYVRQVYFALDENGIYNYEIKNGVMVARDKTQDLQLLLQKQEKERIDNYKKSIVKLIRQRYSLNDELAIQRQKDTKPNEFAEYNAYCEQCKQQVKND